MRKKLLIFGASGFIGEVVAPFLSQYFELETPTQQEADITDKVQISKLIEKSTAEFVWLNAAFTDVKKAEEEREDKKGVVWKINVQGAINVATSCFKTKKHLIYTSTGFAKSNSSWYGVTKHIAEEEIKKSGSKFSIIRIDYPFGNLNSPKDYINKIINMLENNYSVFDDLIVTPTYIPDFAFTIKKVIEEKLEGEFEVACEPNSVYQIAQKVNMKLKNKYEVKIGSVHEYIKKHGKQLWPIDVNLRGFRFHTFDEALDEVL